MTKARPHANSKQKKKEVLRSNQRDARHFNYSPNNLTRSQGRGSSSPVPYSSAIPAAAAKQPSKKQKHGGGGTSREDAVAIDSSPSITSIASSSTAEDGTNNLDNTSAPELSLRAIMINMLSKNSSVQNVNSVSHDTMKAIATSLAINRLKILEAARKTDANNIKLGVDTSYYDKAEAVVPNVIREKENKKECAVILVKAWFILKNITVLDETRSTRSFDLDQFYGTLQQIEEIAGEELENTRVRLRAMKSIPFPTGERERKWCEGGGTATGAQFPVCPKCGHIYIDFPPYNAERDQQNKSEYAKYVNDRNHLRQFKAKERKDPPRDPNGKPLKKIGAPITQKLHVRCHCHQMHRSVLRNGSCPLNCTYGICVICTCACSFLCTTTDYFTYVQNKALDSKSGNNRHDAEEQSRDWFNAGIRAYKNAESDAASYYNEQKKQGSLGRNVDVSRVIKEQASLAQGINIVKNPPPYAVMEMFSKKMNSIQHPKGPTFVTVDGKDVDLRTVGRNSAADSRVTNNGLQPRVEALQPLSVLAVAAGTATAAAGMAVAGGITTAAGSTVAVETTAVAASSTPTPSRAGYTAASNWPFDSPRANGTRSSSKHDTARYAATTPGRPEKISAPNWPFSSPREKVWDRITTKNAQGLHIGILKKDLSEEQKNERRKAKITSAAMIEQQTKGTHKAVIDTMAVGRGVPKDKVGEYERGDVKDKQGKTFNSQDGVDFYRDFQLSLDD